MWIYQQSTGILWNPEGKIVAKGYSGFGEGKNNPELEHVRNVGPIPRGLYVIGEAYRSKRVGPLSLPLYAHLHNALYRTYFRCHGGSKSDPGNASKGCVILWRRFRQMIINSVDKLFYVIE